MARSPAAAPEAQLDALFLPLATGDLRLPDDGRVLCLRARDGARLRELAGPGWHCQQGFRPFADALQRAGLAVGEPSEAARYGLVAVLPPRQR
jgi:16S rRNA (guanine1207-N2)-methyltransferase